VVSVQVMSRESWWLLVWNCAYRDAPFDCFRSGKRKHPDGLFESKSLCRRIIRNLQASLPRSASAREKCSRQPKGNNPSLVRWC
jgi:hypothetical protein